MPLITLRQTVQTIILQKKNPLLRKITLLLQRMPRRRAVLQMMTISHSMSFLPSLTISRALATSRMRFARSSIFFASEKCAQSAASISRRCQTTLTVARLIAKIYKKLGILSTGAFVETDRSGLVAGYVGQTAIKTQEMIKKAMGGVLFIDEAYSLAQGGDNDYGREAIDTLLKAICRGISGADGKVPEREPGTSVPLQ